MMLYMRQYKLRPPRRGVQWYLAENKALFERTNKAKTWHQKLHKKDNKLQKYNI